jgi:hypothetical protein
MREIVILVAVFGALYVFAAWRQHRRRTRQRFLSLVLFFPTPRDLDADALRKASEAAWDFKFPQSETATDWVVGSPPVLMTKARGFHFLVNVLDRGYFSGASAKAAPAPENVPPHGGFLTVDLLATDDPRSDEEVYSRSGPLVEALLTKDCVALFVPPRNLLFPLDTPERLSRVREALRSPDVMASLEALKTPAS